jgi:hypothetical protein
MFQRGGLAFDFRGNEVDFVTTPLVSSGIDRMTDFDCADAEFFSQLPSNRGACSLIVVDLSSGKFPQSAVVLSLRALADKQVSSTFNYRRDYMLVFGR